MTRTTARSRLARRSALLAGVLTLCAAGTAHADVTGSVVNLQGVPLPGIDVTLSEADNSFAASATTDVNGNYRILSSSLSGDTPPFTAKISEFDSCKTFGNSQVEATQPVAADGATANFTVDILAFCGTSFTPSGKPDPTGNAWPERGQLLSPSNGVTYLRVVAPFDASNFAFTLSDGTNVGGGTDRTELTLTAPATYNGPLNLTYTVSGVATTRQIATLIAGRISKPAPPTGAVDVAAIVDISGSMQGSDPGFIRKDAVSLLIDTSDQGDRLVGTGFDDAFTEIFPRTTIAGAATKNALKAAARKGIVNDGGTDYNVGLGSAFDALSADPLNPQVPKAAIFLTDGANNGAYNNAHLRFAFNGTGRPWPICVVQLGTSFSPSDKARLQRIAAETGGQYSATTTNAALTNLFFQCRGTTSGATTLLKKVATFKVGQQKTFSRRIKKNQRKATFFVSFGQGKYAIAAVQPGGRTFTKSTGKNVRAVRGKTFAFIEVLKPKSGLWKVKVKRLPTGGLLDKATTTVTVQKRR